MGLYEEKRTSIKIENEYQISKLWYKQLKHYTHFIYFENADYIFWQTE